MRAVVQRVSAARVSVDGATVGAIDAGLCILLGVAQEDEPADADWLAEKIAHLRIFEDSEGKMNRSLLESGGGALVVSQFTLYGDCRRGRRPSFIGAASPEKGRQLYDAFLEQMERRGIKTERGVFQAHMLVEIANDGPVTLIVDTRKES